jgi:uncharacterized repeat protein (TIGR03803 family)
MKFRRIFLITMALLILAHYVAIGQCSVFYGMTSDGGKYNGGTIFRTNGYGDSLGTVFSPELSSDGRSPYGDLCKAENGKFYGMTSAGGSNYIGVLYEWDPLTNKYTKKLDFNGTETGGWPENALMQADNGRLYGLAEGGLHNEGVLFEWDPIADAFTKKIDFGTYWGSDPVGTMVQANNGKLYGMTRSGGYNYKGLIYEWDPETNEIEVVFSFDGAESGENVVGSLVKDSSGNLYGMTSMGGANDLGVLFELDPETGNFTKKLDFNGSETGSIPYGSPIIAGNNKLYGLTSAGGTHKLGVLFEYDLATNIFSKKFDFDTLNGMHPSGSLTQAGNGKLYGTTSKGGLYDWGVLFEWDPDAGVFTKKLDFNDLGKGYDRGRRSSLIGGSDGSLYGLTSDGGKGGAGTIYEWNYETGVFIDKFDFNYASDGNDLNGSLIQAGNGKFYGTTFVGGIGNYGVLFEWDPVTKIYVKKIDLVKSENGTYPLSLMQARNGKFYGMTRSGGEYNQGVIFEWNILTNTYTKKIDFNRTVTGQFPRGSLIQADNGKLYGINNYGEKIDGGVLFEWDPETNIFTKRVEFGEVDNGFWPEGSLIQANNGKFYGTTERGGIYGGGVLYEWDPVNNKYTKKYDFDISGYYPDGALIQGFNGKLYGMTNSGGTAGGGVLFEYDIAENSCSIKIELGNLIGGRKLLGYLLQASNGKIYGMAYAEGNTFRGVLFEYDPVTNIAIKKFDFTKNSGTTPSSNLIEVGNIRSSFSVLNETACDKYNFNGKILKESGTYYDTIPNAAGCDSLITLNLKVLESSLATLFETACSEYNFNGRLLKTSGTYFDKIPNASGCDSIIVLFLTIIRPTSASFYITSCNEFQFGNKVITQSGIYRDTIPNSVGCDSVMTLHLLITHQTESTLAVSACDSYTSPSGKFTWTTGGIYTDTIPNAAGCDSLITIFLNLPHRTGSTIFAKACDAYLSPSGRYTWTASGTYTDIIQNAGGCDSVITVNLVIGRTVSSIYPVACKNYTSPSGKYIWTSGGTYVDIIPNSAGCDSVITIDLQVDHVDTSVIQDRSVLISNDRIADHQWIDCDDGNVAIPGETYLTYTALKNGHYAVIVSQGVCVDTSSVYEVLLTGLTDQSESRISLYPNPTDGNFTIDLGKICTEAGVTITRYDGQVIRNESFFGVRRMCLTLDALPGLYIVTVYANGREVVFKLLKQ